MVPAARGVVCGLCSPAGPCPACCAAGPFQQRCCPAGQCPACIAPGGGLHICPSWISRGSHWPTSLAWPCPSGWQPCPLAYQLHPSVHWHPHSRFSNKTDFKLKNKSKHQGLLFILPCNSTNFGEFNRTSEMFCKESFPC